MGVLRRLAAVPLIFPAFSPLAAQELARTNPSDATRQELVVTNQNLAVVLDSRRATLPSGDVELSWEQPPATALTETWSVTNAREAGVRFAGLKAPLPAERPGSREWLAGLVGRRVRIHRLHGETAEGDVLSVHGSTPNFVLFREGDELVYGEPDARLSLPAAAGEASRPSGVTLKLVSERAGARVITSRYLVRDVTWTAHYALSLASDEKTGRLEGFFVVDNGSGGEFAPARLRLLAGVLRIASGQGPMPMMAGRAQAMMKEDVEVASSVAASESRMYEVPSPRRLPPGRVTFPLAQTAPVAVEKRYVVRSTWWMGQNEESQRLPVAVQYRVVTKELASALPAGVVRVYGEEGALFLGEDTIEHTPEKTDVEVETSEAFDLSARRRQAAFQQISRFETETTVEMTLESRKKEAVTVLVRESFPGDWQVLESSVPARKVSARLAEFAVPVPASGAVKLTYKVRVRTGS